MNLTTAATLFLASSLVISSTSAIKGDGFYASGIIDFDSTLEGNTDIIGAHLHTGTSTTNGPVNVIFCGGEPLPDVLSIDGPCEVRDALGEDSPPVEEGRYVKSWEAIPYDDLLTEVFTNGANNATSVSGATTLADGAPTTFDSFLEELLACTVDACNVYFNIHTNYSFNLNAGAYGLARAQLSPVPCDKKELKPEYSIDTAKCFNAIATSSNNTNMVTGIPNQLAPNAGYMYGDLLVVYQGGGGTVEDSDVAVDNTASNEEGVSSNYDGGLGPNSTEPEAEQDKFSSSASLSLSLLSLIIAAVTMSTLLISPLMML